MLSGKLFQHRIRVKKMGKNKTYYRKKAGDLYEEDEWGDRNDRQRKRYDKVKSAINKARKLKKKQRDLSL